MTNKLSNLKNPQSRIYIKGIAIFVIVLILMIPNAFIQSLIYERQNLQKKVEREVSSSWGRAQHITAPVLVIPFTINEKDENDQWVSSRENYIVMPDQLNINADLKTTVRKRSIYNVLLYRSSLSAHGKFIIPDEIIENELYRQVLWDEAFISVGISDVTALQGRPKFEIDNKSFEISTGAGLYNYLHAGFTINNINTDGVLEDFNYNFSCEINGSESFHINPIAKTTIIDINSDWKSPSFFGNFLPQKHKIDDNGFNAHWEVGEFNRNFPSYWIGNKYDFKNQLIAVKFVDPVNDYHKNMRTAKYAILIIGLSFLLFFFIELLSGMRIHPIQYVLVGIALTVFYTLLISITEHIGFDIAYIISSCATIGLIGIYCYSIIEKKKKAFVMVLILGFLYFYIYIILQLEDFSLLIGSIGLFTIISCIMLYTRKVDYYQLNDSSNQ